MKLGFIGTGQIAKATILGILGSNLKKFLNNIVATSAIPIGMPGCPELAFSTASIDKNLIAFDNSMLFFLKGYPV